MVRWVRVCYLDGPLIGVEPMTYFKCAVRLLDFDMKHTGLGLSSAMGSIFNQSERRSLSFNTNEREARASMV